MAKELEIFKCEICGNIVELVHGGVGELSCCNEPMKQMIENTVDAIDSTMTNSVTALYAPR